MVKTVNRVGAPSMLSLGGPSSLPFLLPFLSSPSLCPRRLTKMIHPRHDTIWRIAA